MDAALAFGKATAYQEQLTTIILHPTLFYPSQFRMQAVENSSIYGGKNLKNAENLNTWGKTQAVSP